MTKKKILETLIELKNSVKEFNEIKYQSTKEKKDLHEKITLLYGKIKPYYLYITGNKNIEVPVAGSNLKSKYNNYFEAGYLSGRTFHSHNGYLEIIEVFGEIEVKKNIRLPKPMNSQFTQKNILRLIGSFIFVGSTCFWAGNYYGNHQFDQSKNELVENFNELKSENSTLRNYNKIKSDSIKTLLNEIGYLKSIIPEVENIDKLKINISYQQPTSIFNGQVLISANNKSKKELEFQGVKGVDKNLDGEFINNSIIVEKGDRFFLKLENDEIWSINVINLLTGIDIELNKK